MPGTAPHGKRLFEGTVAIGKPPSVDHFQPSPVHLRDVAPGERPEEIAVLVDDLDDGNSRLLSKCDTSIRVDRIQHLLRPGLIDLLHSLVKG